MNAPHEGALQRVRAQYLARVPSHLTALWDMVSEPFTDQKRDDATRLAHRLKGSSGSYGLLDLSRHLAELEGLLGKTDVPVMQLQAVLSACNLSGDLDKAKIPTEEAHPPTLQPRPARGSTSGRVVLVELAPDLAERCVRLLREHPVEVFVCANLEDAERVAGRGFLEFALIQTTPSHSVAESVDRLRLAASNWWLPVATFCDRSTVREHREAAAAGVDVFLSTFAPDGPIQEAFDQLFESSSQIAPKVLLVDDDPDFSSSLEVILSSTGLRAQSLNDPTAVLEALDAWEPDALTLDVDMPELRGPEICAILRSTPRWQTLPIIMLTGRADRELCLACYRAGCDDYIVKPFDQEELVARLLARVTRKRVLMRAERDPLSGLILRRPFAARSHLRASEARRHRVPLSICLLDLDHFKSLNDSHGHIAADRVISTLGRLLRSRLREEDIAGRWGGEEFALALPHTDSQAAHSVVMDLLRHLASVHFVDDQNQTFRATFSAGIATFPGDGDAFDRLLAVADARLYEAKHAGRARVRSAPPPSWGL